MTEAKTAITYARVSTEEQSREGYSLAGQREATRRWCEAEGYEILEELADPGHSGAYLERPDLDRLRDLVAAGTVSVVVVQDRDRLAREPAYVYILMEEFGRHGTRVVALNARGDGSPEGELADGMLDQLAKYERAKMLERTRRGLDRKVAEGKIIRGNKAPYGFAYDERGEALLVSEPEMGVVRRIFRMVGAEGASMGEVERRLNREGIPSSTGGKWCRQSVRYLVLNELYRPHSADEVAASGMVRPEVVRTLDEEGVYGLWVRNRMRVKRRRERTEDGDYRNRVKNEVRPREAWMAVPVSLTGAGLVPQLVDAARKRLAENKPRGRANTRRFWELRGGIAWCGVCGNGFSTHHVYERNGIRFYYRCYKRYNYGLDECSNNRHMQADVMEEAVWRAVFSIITKPEKLRRQYQEHIDRQLRRLRGNPDREARVLVGRLQMLESRRSRFIDLAGDGTITREDLRAKLAEVDSQRADFQKALRETHGRQETLKRLEWERDHNLHLVEALGGSRYVTASPQDRHRIYKALQLRVEVDEDRTIRLSGVFDPPLLLGEMVQDLPVDPSKPIPLVPDDLDVVVTLTSAAPCTS
jgi:site-specific DNA recombinase